MLLNRVLVALLRVLEVGRLAEVVKWQTRYVQGVVGAIPWRFKSSLRHRTDGETRGVSRNAYVDNRRTITHGPIAQLGERLNGIQEVRSSSLLRSTVRRHSWGRCPPAPERALERCVAPKRPVWWP